MKASNNKCECAGYSAAHRLCSVTGSLGFAPAWVWTTAAWFNLISDKKQQAFGTPLQSTSTLNNIISSSTRRVKIYCSCQGRNMFPFYNFSAKEDRTNASPFHSLLLTRLNLCSLFAPVSLFFTVPSLKSFPGDCVLLLVGDSYTTELRLPLWYCSFLLQSSEDAWDLVFLNQFICLCPSFFIYNYHLNTVWWTSHLSRVYN